MAQKPRYSNAEIIAAIKKAARKLKRAPTREEFGRLSRITASQVMWAFGTYKEGLRAAGVKPLGRTGRIGTRELLEDWGRVVRKMEWHPRAEDYKRLGKFSLAALVNRIGRWSEIRGAFLEMVRANGLEREWADVVETLRTKPFPTANCAGNWESQGKKKSLPRINADKRGSKKKAAEALEPENVLPELRGMRCVSKTMLWVLCGANGRQKENAKSLKYKGSEEPEKDKALPQINTHEHRLAQGTRGLLEPISAPRAQLPAELEGKRCVTQSMLWILFADEKPSMLEVVEQNFLPRIRPDEERVGEIGHGALALSLHFPRRAIPGRAMMGPPLSLNGRAPHGLMREPVNESGVVFLFGMVAHLLGFDVEALQGAYPDGEGKLEVEPGRWQNIRFEFEYESRKFMQHRHDAKKCDVIVCWKHNWKGCPEEIQVVELRRILRWAEKQNLTTDSH